MSAHFAIPATTFVLRAILEARLKAAYGTFTAPPVSIGPPPRLPAPTNGTPVPEPAGLTLYLHHAGPNPALRNMYEPDVENAGAPRPPLVLNLHYMLAAHGLDLERETVLGIGMSAFHRNGIVAKSMISSILDPIVVPQSPTKLMDSLTAEPLEDQLQSITITPQAVDIDLSTKLWSALQSPLRPAAFYLVTTVVLATDEKLDEGPPVTMIRLFELPNVAPEVDLAGDADSEITAPLP